MANITYDTELMINHIAATPVAAGSVFTTVLEPRTRRPAVISLSNANPAVLELIKEDDAGNRKLVDLGKKLHLPAGAIIQAFVAEQAEDLRVYLAVAVRNDTKSEVNICKPFLLDKLDSISLYPKQVLPTVNSLFMGSVIDPDSYPLLVADIQPPKRENSKSSDMRAIWVDATTATQLQTFGLPENAERILSVAVASYGALGKGLWILYSTQGESKLICNLATPGDNGEAMRFPRLEPKFDFKPTTIASYTDKDMRSGLLVGTSEGLYNITAKDCINSSKVNNFISGDDFYKSSVSISVAQDGQKLTVWGLSQDGQLGYLTTEVTGLEQQQKPGTKLGTTLLGKQSSSSFSASISQPSPDAKLSLVSQTIISNDFQGHLELLSQNRDSGIWRFEPFGVAHHTETVSVPSYALRITVQDQKNLLVVNGQVRMVASSDTTAYVNGRTYNLTSNPEGTWLPLDATGVLAVIIPTNMVSGRYFNVTQVTDMQNKDVKMAGSAIKIDPSVKVLQKLCEKLGGETELTELKTQSKQKLWSDNDPKPSPDDLKAAQDCFQNMHQACSDVLHPKSSRAASSHEALSDVGDWLMDKFHHVKDAVEHAVKWMVEKIQGVWRFVCEIAGETKKFVLDTIEKIGEAAQWVWNKIKLGFSKMLDFLGHLFGWDDIKNTSDDIYSLLVGSVDWVSDGITKVEPKIESLFDDLKGKIKTPALNKTKKTKEVHDGRSNSSVKASNSPAYNYLTDRMRNGNPGKSGTPSTTTSTTVDPTFEDILKPLGESTIDLLTNVANDVSELFHSEGDLSPSELFRKLRTDILVNSIDIIKSIVVGATTFLRKSIGAFKGMMTGKIEIPIISALYKICTNDDLDWLKLVSFILGFMTCTMSKIVTGNAPPRLKDPGLKMLNKIVDGKLAEPEEKANALFFTGVGMSISAVSIVYDAITTAKGVLHVGAAETAVGSVSSGTFGIALDIAELICILPNDPGAPGYELRNWIAYLSAASIGMELALMIGCKGPDPAAEKGVAAFRFIIDVVSACLYGIVFSKELEVEKKDWAEKDDDLTDCAICEDVIGTAKSCGKFVCEVSAESPASAAVGLAVMAAAGLGLTVNKGFTLNLMAKANSHCYRGALC